MTLGGDYLFYCFSTHLLVTPEQHFNSYTCYGTIAQEFLENSRKYNLPTSKNHRSFTKTLPFVKYPGKLLIEQAIEAFIHIYQIKALVFYGNCKSLQFRHLQTPKTY